MGEVIQAAHLFRTDPPTEADSALWTWAQEYIDGPILNLQALVDDLTDASTEEEFADAAIALRTEVKSWPDFD